MAYKIKEVSKEEISKIIDTREPKGLFWHKDKNLYVGVDNTTGEAWTEEFKEFKDCENFLLDY